MRTRATRNSGSGARTLDRQIAALFANGDQGWWFDPSDFETLYQDRLGQVPVTATGQPVGLMLDKRLKGQRGVEQLTNGTFDVNAAGWNPNAGSISWSAGRATFTSTNTTGGIEQARTLEAGKYYEFTGDLEALTADAKLTVLRGAAGSYARLADSVIVPVGQRQVVKVLVYSPSTDVIVLATVGTMAGNVTVDNLSMREVPGNHASQPTTTKRPVLNVSTNGKYYLQGDGTDDILVLPTIDATAYSKMVFGIGVMKNASAVNMIFETDPVVSTGTTAFQLHGQSSAGPAGAGYKLSMSGGGTAASVDIGTPAQNPIYDINLAVGIDAVLDRSGAANADQFKIAVNGVDPAPTESRSGGVTGNFGNVPVSVFGRKSGGTEALWFNGRIYGFVAVFRTNIDNVQNERPLLRRYITSKL